MAIEGVALRFERSTLRAFVLGAVALLRCAGAESNDGLIDTLELDLVSSVEGCSLLCGPGDLCHFPGALPAGTGAAIAWCSTTVVANNSTLSDHATSYENGAFTIRSNMNGIDFAGNSYQTGDGVRFLYTQWKGLPGCSGSTCTDVELVVHVQSTDSTAVDPIEVGVMLRDAPANFVVPPTGVLAPQLPGGARMGSLAFFGNQADHCGFNDEVGQFMTLTRTTPDTNASLLNENTRVSPPDMWLRIQRVGKDFATARSRDWGRTWVPTGGGEFAPTSGFAPLIGAFVAVRGDVTLSARTAKLDVVYLGPPRLEYRTTWLGTERAAASTGGIGTPSAHSFWVAPNGTTFKTSDNSEFVHTNGVSATGVPFKAYAGETDWGVPRGGLTGYRDLSSNKTYLFVARRNPDQPGEYWIEKLVGEPASSGDVDLPLSFKAKYPNAPNCPAVAPIGAITGLAARRPTGAGVNYTELYVSDLDHEVVHVLNWPDSAAACVTEIEPAISMPRVGPVAVDLNNNVWVVRPSTPYPDQSLYNEFKVPECPPSSGVPCDPPEMSCRKRQTCSVGPACPAGSTWVDCGSIAGYGLINKITNPVGIAASSNAPARLLITDNGISQNVRICDVSNPSAPSCAAAVGQKGGVFAANTPAGLVTSGTGIRLFSPLGAGFDASGSVFVADHANGVAIHKTTAPGWDTYGLGAAPGAFDPASPSGSFHTHTRRFDFDTTKTAPGSEWALRAVTWNPFDDAVAPVMADGNIVDTLPTGRVNDLRVSAKAEAWPPILRRLPNGTANDPLFMFVPYTAGGRFNLSIFRFTGEVAVPCGAVEFSSTPAGSRLNLWVDSNADKLRDANEETWTSVDSGWVASDVNSAGTIWLGFPSSFWRLRLIGVLANGVPNYSLTAPGGIATYPVPASFAGAYGGLRHEPIVGGGLATGTLYLIGRGPFTPEDPACHAPGNEHLGAYTVHLSGQPLVEKFPPVPLPRISTSAPDDFPEHPFDEACDCASIDEQVLRGGFADRGFNSMAIAGDYVFIGERPGPIHVHRKSTGKEVTRLIQGPEASGTVNPSDRPQLVVAHEHPSGEYLVARAETADRARTTVFRWTPSPVFTPWDLNPLAWYVAAASDVQQAGNKVIRWADRSGNHHELVQTVPSAQPTFNPKGWNGAKPTVTFDGTDLFSRDWTETPGGVARAFSVLAVLRTSSASTEAQGIASWWSEVWPNAIFARLVRPSGAPTSWVPALLRTDAANVTQSATGTQNLGTSRHVLAWRFNPSTNTMTFDVDGTSVSTSVASTQPGNIALQTFVLGASSPLPTERFAGDVSELVVVPRSVDNAELAAFRTYAAQTWTGLP